jgi:Protein of unknown function (DUF1552)
LRPVTKTTRERAEREQLESSNPMSKHSSNPRDVVAERRRNLSRRGFLRGLGVCIALPTFESLSPVRLLANSAGAAAAGTVGKAPVRMAFLTVPNGIIPAAWWPAGKAGKGFELSPTLQPFEKVKNEIQVISGLDDLSATAGADGAGDHARAGGTFLTGVRIRKTAGADILAGTSFDQVVASKMDGQTRFRSLELTCSDLRKSGDCDSGYSCVYPHNLSWRSPTQPMVPDPNPRAVFERLFGEGSASQRVANFHQRQKEQASILDFVLDDARAMDRKLDGSDRAKLEQYLTAVREIEQRIDQAERMSVVTTSAEAPAGIPQGYAERIGVMFDMLLLAFQSDSTRIATMIIAPEGDNRSFPEIGLSEGHHNLSHHDNNPDPIEKVKKIDLFYTQQLAGFLEKMAQMKDVDGTTLLHNSMILYGSGNADGNSHTHTNLPILVAGSAGGRLATGRYLKVQPQPLTNLFLTMGDAMGATGIQRHGDSTGRLAVA